MPENQDVPYSLTETSKNLLNKYPLNQMTERDILIILLARMDVVESNGKITTEICTAHNNWILMNKDRVGSIDSLKKDYYDFKSRFGRDRAFLFGGWKTIAWFGGALLFVLVVIGRLHDFGYL